VETVHVIEVTLFDKTKAVLGVFDKIYNSTMLIHYTVPTDLI